MSSFAEMEKMRLSQKISKKNSVKDNKGIFLFLFNIYNIIYRRSKIFIEINDEWYEKKSWFYW